jgi:hypothetical protein
MVHDLYDTLRVKLYAMLIILRFLVFYNMNECQGTKKEAKKSKRRNMQLFSNVTKAPFNLLN